MDKNNNDDDDGDLELVCVRGVAMDALMSDNGNFVFSPEGDGQPVEWVEEWLDVSSAGSWQQSSVSAGSSEGSS